ncbi:MAG: hypothetical protein IT371_23165 [Deltaproteobacteria bacterium]|nr:hypothetical protein [Deltaproteobacteria bacterium]
MRRQRMASCTALAAILLVMGGAAHARVMENLSTSGNALAQKLAQRATAAREALGVVKAEAVGYRDRMVKGQVPATANLVTYGGFLSLFIGLGVDVGLGVVTKDGKSQPNLHINFHTSTSNYGGAGRVGVGGRLSMTRMVRGASSTEPANVVPVLEDRTQAQRPGWAFGLGVDRHPSDQNHSSGSVTDTTVIYLPALVISDNARERRAGISIPFFFGLPSAPLRQANGVVKQTGQMLAELDRAEASGDLNKLLKAVNKAEGHLEGYRTTNAGISRQLTAVSNLAHSLGAVD